MTQIAYDDETHTYWINGQKATSVTESLRTAGLIQGIQFASEDALWRGKAVHAAINFYHKGTLNWYSVDERIIPYLNGYIKFQTETRFTPIAWEKKISIPQLNLAGTLDLLGTFPDGRTGLIDYKTGLESLAISPWVGLQLALYDMGLGMVSPPRIRFGLKLNGDGDYRLHRFDDPGDYPVALSAVNIANWRKKHGQIT